MLIFADESWDAWFDFKKHSSLLFTIWIVLFEEHEEAIQCDEAINELRKELKLPENYEFHYTKDSDRIKEAFIKKVAPFNFFYYWLVINKTLLDANNFNMNEPFYKYVCALTFENIKQIIHEATVVIDWSYWKKFENKFQKYLKDRINAWSSYRIKKVKMQDSKKNNLLQLADYIASWIQRWQWSKKENYLKPIKHREIEVQIRPKE